MDAHWLSGKRLVLYPSALCLLYLSLAALMLVRFPHGIDSRGNTLRPDFIVFWAASHQALTGDPQGAYDLDTIARTERLTIKGFEAKGRWVYPPTFYLMVLPLALLPFFWSYLAFTVSTFLAYIVVLRKIAAAPLALMPILGFPAVCINFVQGQNGFLIAALLGGALLLLQDRPVWAGFLIGLMTIKPQTGVLLPLVLLSGGHWRAFAVAALTAVAFLMISVGVLGPDTLKAFWAGLGGFSEWAAGNEHILLVSPSFFAFFHLLGLSYSAALVAHCVVALPVAAATAWIWRVCRDDALRSAALATASLLMSPYILDYDTVCLALPIAWFVRYAMRQGWRKGEREMLLLAWLLPALLVLIHHFIGVQFSPFIVLGLFLMILLRVLDGRNALPSR
jgi:hypothetical protein